MTAAHSGVAPNFARKLIGLVRATAVGFCFCSLFSGKFRAADSLRLAAGCLGAEAGFPLEGEHLNPGQFKCKYASSCQAVEIGAKPS